MRIVGRPISLQWGCAVAIAAVLLMLSAQRADCADSPAAPGFGRHVVPLLSKLGCNGGGCHGAVQEKNGFRLSLFGADPHADYAQLAIGAAGRRINPLEVEKSLFLLKATAQVPHEGGKRIEVKSAEHELLLRWLAGGARRDERAQFLVKQLKVSPAEQVVEPGKSYRLRVEATFDDGSTEEVTAISSFESRHRSVVTVTADGIVTAAGVGDAAIDRKSVV